MYFWERERAPGAVGSFVLAAVLTTLMAGMPCHLQGQPTADSCKQPTPLIAGVTAFFDNSRATTDGCGDCPIDQDLWYVYQATVSGAATFSTCGSFFDSALAIYDGNACPTEGTSALACADGGCGNDVSVTLPLVAGHNYLVRVGSSNCDGGAGQLLLSAPCGELDQFLCVYDGVHHEVALGWAGSGPYAMFRLLLDDVLLANLPGTATTYLHSNPPVGQHVYRLEAVCVSAGVVTRTCSVTVLTPESPFRRGDCQLDGAVNVADVVSLVLGLFGAQPFGPCIDACDADDDGQVTAGDAMKLLGFLFLGEAALPPPVVCGNDGGEDALHCQGATMCP